MFPPLETFWNRRVRRLVDWLVGGKDIPSPGDCRTSRARLRATREGEWLAIEPHHAPPGAELMRARRPKSSRAPPRTPPPATRLLARPRDAGRRAAPPRARPLGPSLWPLPAARRRAETVAFRA